MDASNTAKRPTILASIGRRLAARLIDCVIAVLIFFVVKFAAGALSAYVPAVTPSKKRCPGSTVTGAISRDSGPFTRSAGA